MQRQIRKGTSLRYQNYQQEKLALNDVLALDRTRLANERTFLAYLRAAIMMGVSSITIFKLLPDRPLLVILAQFLIPVAFVVVGVGAFRSVRLAKSLRQLEQASNGKSS